MRRVNNLYPAVIAFDNLYAAYRRALKGNEGKKPGLKFFFHAETEIIRLHRELSDGSYVPGAYHYFKCFEPKERIIAVAPFRDRVVHHAIVGILNPIYERIFITDSFATRKNKGVHKAIERARYFIRNNAWYLKSDVQKYFNSVDHEVLLKLFARKIKDVKLLDLLEKITVNGGSDGRGIPIGNQTSQFFSNIYLDQLDHFIKEKKKMRGYIRYMDDFVVFSNDKDELLRLRQEIPAFLEENLKLQLKEKATYMNSRSNGLSFLGRRIFPSLIRIQSENLKRCLKTIERRRHEYAAGLIDEKRLIQSQASCIANLKLWQTYHLRKKIYAGQIS